MASTVGMMLGGPIHPFMACHTAEPPSTSRQDPLEPPLVRFPAHPEPLRVASPRPIPGPANDTTGTLGTIREDCR